MIPSEPTVSVRKPKTILFVRHGESEYNAQMRHCRTWASPLFWWRGLDPDIRDAPLTPRGCEQAIQLGRQLADAQLVDRLRVGVCVVSPLQRAVDTALLALRRSPGATISMRNLPIVVCPLHREIAHSTCDVGQHPAKLSAKFPELDFSELPDGWWRPSGLPQHRADNPRMLSGEPQKSILLRMDKFLAWLHERPETCVLVIGHSQFTKALTDMPKLGNCGVLEMNLTEGKLQRPDVTSVPLTWFRGPSQTTDSPANKKNQERGNESARRV